MREPPRDPRDFQIAALSLLLGWGLFRLHFDLAPAQVVVTFAAALGAQLVGTRLAGLHRFDPRSALISALSLCLLLRTGSLAVAALAAALAIGSKFLLRARGKHLFNPTNFGLVVLLLATDKVWASPGQWGNAAFFACLFACAGGLVAHRALRNDVALAFILTWAGLLAARTMRLGDPAVIPLHRLESGALLLFTFFMISDPKTTPDSRSGRIFFGVLVAIGAWYVQFRLFRTNGFLYALFFLSPLVPLIDRVLPGRRYAWPQRGGALNTSTPKGAFDEKTLPLAHPAA